MRIEPTDDNVLIRPSDPETKSPGGIVLVSTSRSGRERGVVVAAGPGNYQHGLLVPMRLKVGDTVLYQSYDSHEVKIDGVEHYLTDESSVLGVIRD